MPTRPYAYVRTYIQVSKTLVDDGDKHSMEFVFAEERKRANDRIIQATKTHENTIKMAVLSMMNLGGGVK